MKRVDTNTKINKELNQKNKPEPIFSYKNENEKLKTLLTEKEVVLSEKESLIASLTEEVSWLKSQLKLLDIKKYDKKSEKMDPNESSTMDKVGDEKNTLTDPEPEEPKTKPKKSKTRGNRKTLPDDIQREKIVHDLKEEEKICPIDGSKLEKIGEEISEKLKLIPAKLVVERHARLKYICKTCGNIVITAALPPQILPKSNATPSLLANIITAKYSDSLPLYRQEQIFKRLNINLPRTTLARWMIKVAEKLSPLHNLLKEKILDSNYLGMDETTVDVLKKTKKKSKRCYMWIMAQPNRKSPLVAFEFSQDRSQATPNELLLDYKGYLQTDDYGGYNKVGTYPDIKRVGCLAHARRKFKNAYDTAPSKEGLAKEALDYFSLLYEIEQKSRDYPPEERKQYRQENALAIWEKFKLWLDDHLSSAPPRSYLGNAMHYLSKNWDRLQVYLEDGVIEIDNNLVENYIRPFVIGRKNWLFSYGLEGAKASAILYSLVITAKENNLNIYKYFDHILTVIPSASSVDDYEALLPNNIADTELFLK